MSTKKEDLSVFQRVMRLPPDKRREWLNRINSPTAASLMRSWPDWWARPSQLPPEGDWDVFLYMAGRGAGKTRSAAEWSISQAVKYPGSRGALVGQTASDIRDVMVEGQSGIMACVANREDITAAYEPSKRRITFSNDSIITTYTAEKPRQLRGPQHHWAWCDEIASWSSWEAFDQLRFGLRLGDHPKVMVTTTPKVIGELRKLRDDPKTIVVTGSTYDNADNLSAVFLQAIKDRYEGTTMGRQELYAELFDSLPGALWQPENIEKARLRTNTNVAHTRIVVAVDPAVSAKEGSDETGIVVCGQRGDGHYTVIADASGRYTPEQWASRAVGLYEEHKADAVVAESNQGGDMVMHTLRNVGGAVNVRLVHASRAKVIRAEPVAALYEQGKIHHLGVFPKLESQMCTYMPGDPSPDRLDALVWGISYLTKSRGAIMAGVVAAGGGSAWSNMRG